MEQLYIEIEKLNRFHENYKKYSIVVEDFIDK